MRALKAAKDVVINLQSAKQRRACGFRGCLQVDRRLRQKMNDEESFIENLPFGFRMKAEASGYSQVFQAGGNQVINENKPSFYLGQFPLSPPALDVRWLGIQPSRMLRAQLEVVPFSGRKADLSHLKKWRDSTLTNTAVHLIYGPGGQGKTRLAMHLARAWVDEGWIAFSAISSDNLEDLNAVELLREEGAAGRLIIVDYADRWEPADLLALLRKVADSTGLPVRVIMLARPSGKWWVTLSRQIEERLCIAVDQMYLLPLAESPEDRSLLFEEARDEFRARLGVQNTSYIRPPLDLETNKNYSQILTIHMAALAAVVAFIEHDNLPRNPAELSAFLLARERDYWLSMSSLRSDPIRTAPDAMRQIVYAATLTGPLSYPDALSALKRAQIESQEHPGQLIKDHARCYPPYNSDNALEPLYPDRLGEDFIALTIPGHNNDHIYPPDPWALGALVRLLSPLPISHGLHGPPPWVLSARSLLNEIGARWPHVASLTLGGRLKTGKHHRRL